MATGYLSVQVKLADSALPVRDAQVTIYDELNNVIYELTTDEAGSTPKVTLTTLDRSLSLDPNYIGAPYTLYQAEVKKEGYNNLFIDNIRIFDGQSAIQPVSLIPMLQNQTNRQTYEITLNEPAVEQKDAREQEGSSTQSRILRQVVIPNPITVHLGTPDTDASNVQSSFIDYVKNVVSSEIYPTWPEEALKANIYAIITFALHRIYTECYRGRGYNFDITNSTAYDQYYVYGQTIYESINNLVNEQFNDYVTRAGATAPYFTGFCNGTTAICDGLSQWGTVLLANKGYSASEILSYYYGEDIEMKETNLIAGILSTYPGKQLKLGSTGLDVQTMKNYLMGIRKSFPSIPIMTDEDGVFGKSTEAAVKQFQRIFNLTSNGIIGKETWNQISRTHVAVARIVELDAEGDALGVGTVPPNSTLRLGSTGNDVLTLQYLLNYISLYYPTILAPSQNGILDSQTKDSVLAFQKMMGLTADGFVGKNTWNSLYDVYLGIINTTNLPAPNSNYIDYVVKSGDTLWILAIRYKTTVDAIKKLNGLSSNTIYIGQLWKIPYNSTNPPYYSYNVKSGDTLWLLSKHNNTTVAAMKELNQLTSDILTIGQKLLIPIS